MRTAKIDFEQYITSHLLANLHPALKFFRAAFDLNLSIEDQTILKTRRFEDIVALLRVQVRPLEK